MYFKVKLLVTGQISETPCLTNGNLKWKRVCAVFA